MYFDISPTVDNINSFYWQAVDETSQRPFNLESLGDLTKSFDLCISGPILAHLSNIEANSLSHLSNHVKVFARVSPRQKEEILVSLNNAGMFTLMCGDGTNDVGALKQAHVGKSSIVRT